MYRPLPKELTIKDSSIEGLGLFSKVKLKKNSFLGVTHIRDELFESKYSVITYCKDCQNGNRPIKFKLYQKQTLKGEISLTNTINPYLGSY